MRILSVGIHLLFRLPLALDGLEGLDPLALDAASGGGGQLPLPEKMM